MSSIDYTVGAPALAQRRQSQRSEAIGQYAIALLCLVLVAIPLAPLLLQTFSAQPIYAWDGSFTLRNFQHLFGLPEIPALAGTTLLFCVISILFSTVFGTVLALLVGRTNIPLRGALSNILLWPMFVSPLVIGFGAILTYGPSGYLSGAYMRIMGAPAPWDIYTIWGLSLMSGVAMAPMTILYCISSAQQQDPRLEAAARASGSGPLRIVWRITIPLMRPALVSAFIMNVVAALEMFAIPLLLGGPVGIQLITTFIYDKGFEAGRPDYGLVSAAAIILLVMVCSLVALQQVLLCRVHRFISVGPKGTRLQPLDLGAWRWPAFGFVTAYIALTMGALAFGLLLRSFVSILSPFISPLEVLTLENYRDLLVNSAYRQSVMNTLLLAVIGGFVATALVGVIAFVAQRSTFRFRATVDLLAQLPRAVPGLIVSLGVFYAAIFMPGLGVIAGTLWILGLAYVIRHLPAGYGIVAPALLQVTRDFDRSAQVVGASWALTMRRIIAPVLKPAFLACYTLMMILFLKEYAAAIFLYRPGNEVISMTMLTAWIPGYTGIVSSLAVLQIAITAVLILIATRQFGVKLHG
ncbi:iron ABC transporter permease [Microvirga sp. VF16]|uniref:ABC transporter permease n=1 Tax=Microvirga sp. VF16 TaxID=2807101 RepID=UPI00193CE9FB|nr:iron ABC transporter permease [Microvirga sp. VF16]QRM32658.1 iron ABC transporter permease [Microvirga sp. VF16]